MKALVVYCHPKPTSFNHAVKELVLEKLAAKGAETRLIDLYGEGFNPALSAHEWDIYLDLEQNRTGIESHCDALAWCDTLIFVYPTWWYGLPAMLKGWIDRIFVPGLAFHMPSPNVKDIEPGLNHIKRLGVYTTAGATWWFTRLIGAPGKRTLLRGVRVCCAKTCRTSFANHYKMDASTDESRKAHLVRVGKKLDRLLKG